MTPGAMTAIERTAIQPADGESFDFGGLGVVWKIESAETGGRFSVVEHPIRPRSLAAPLHLHHNEDEYSFVLEGTLGALLGERMVEAGPGTWVFKPHAEWHTFWNAGDTECRILEVISPGGFENYFRELADAFRDADAGPPDGARLGALAARYALEMDVDSVPGLCERFGLTHPRM